jgi:uncharacterized protein YgbK (DUF1537 family)
MTIPTPATGITGAIKAICLVVVVVMVFGLVGYLAYTKAQLQKQVGQQAAIITGLQSANTDWQMQTTAANLALKKLTDDEAVRAAAAAAAEAVAEKVGTALADQATVILATKPQGDDCAATTKLFDTFFAGKK